MPARLPSFDNAYQQQLLKLIQRTTLYPYSFAGFLTVNAANFPTSDAPGIGSYFSQSLLIPNTSSLIAVQATAAFINADGTAVTQNRPYMIAVSYLNSFVGGGGPGTATAPPQDSGNIVYQQIFGSAQNFNNFVYWQPNNYYLSAKSTLYLYVDANSTDVTAATIKMYYSVTLHTQPTGLQA